MILYEYNNNKFKKNNKRISKQCVVSELKKYQFKTLVEKGKIKVKINNSESKGEQLKKDMIVNNITNISEPLENKEQQRANSSNKLLTKAQIRKIDKVRNLYRVDHIYYAQKGWKYELWCKNKKGFYNFIAYLENDSEHTIQKAILKDLQNRT